MSYSEHRVVILLGCLVVGGGGFGRSLELLLGFPFFPSSLPAFKDVQGGKTRFRDNSLLFNKLSLLASALVEVQNAVD